MFQKYKEIFYGLLFGIGAGIIDANMHARMERGSFWSELIRPQPAMIFYRVLFVFFGLALGLVAVAEERAPRFSKANGDDRAISSRDRRTGPPDAHQVAACSDYPGLASLTRSRGGHPFRV
jgi:hypothetical protein